MNQDVDQPDRKEQPGENLAEASGTGSEHLGNGVIVCSRGPCANPTRARGGLY